MCQPSQHIKFCTCPKKDQSIEELDHYWILYRYNLDKGVLIVGSMAPPMHGFSDAFESCKEEVLATLNGKDAFDTPIDLKEMDRLEVVINNNGKPEEEYIYEFEYTEGKWVYHDHYPFGLESDYDEQASGEVEMKPKLSRNLSVRILETFKVSSH